MAARGCSLSSGLIRPGLLPWDVGRFDESERRCHVLAEEFVELRKVHRHGLDAEHYMLADPLESHGHCRVIGEALTPVGQAMFAPTQGSGG